MKIFVTAKPNSKTTNIEKIDETHFIVSVKEPPVQGRANSAVIKALAEHFSTAQSNIQLISGFSSKQKTFEISLP